MPLHKRCYPAIAVCFKSTKDGHIKIDGSIMIVIKLNITWRVVRFHLVCGCELDNVNTKGDYENNNNDWRVPIVG